MIPEEFFSRLKEILDSEQFLRVKDALHGPKVTSFRANVLRATVNEVEDELAAAGIKPASIPWYSGAWWVPETSRAALLASAPFADQKIYVQNQSSMVPPLVLAPEPGERVLDLAAAPGSKTLQMACMMNNEGELAAVDAVRKRFFKLRDNLEAQGATIVRTFLKDGRAVWKHRPEHFDRVLLDAPCSSEGRFHAADPESYAYWTPRKVKEMAHKQKRLLYSAVQSLRVGGTLVYSTCSFAPEENESIVHGLLKRMDGAVEAVPLEVELDQMTPALEGWGKKSFDPGVQHARRILPSYHTDGFFVCKMVKHESTLGR